MKKLSAKFLHVGLLAVCVHIFACIHCLLTVYVYAAFLQCLRFLFLIDLGDSMSTCVRAVLDSCTPHKSFKNADIAYAVT
jgi:hypothetical protein